jgi:hypothetical protein
MDPDVARLVALASTHGVETLSLDDDPLVEDLEVASAWFATALMVWREYDSPTYERR